MKYSKYFTINFQIPWKIFCLNMNYNNKNEYG